MFSGNWGESRSCLEALQTSKLQYKAGKPHYLTLIPSGPAKASQIKMNTFDPSERLPFTLPDPRPAFIYSRGAGKKASLSLFCCVSFEDCFDEPRFRQSSAESVPDF